MRQFATTVGISLCMWPHEVNYIGKLDLFYIVQRILQPHELCLIPKGEIQSGLSGTRFRRIIRNPNWGQDETCSFRQRRFLAPRYRKQKMRKKGTAFEQSEPYTRQENVVAEISNRAMMDKAARLLWVLGYKPSGRTRPLGLQFIYGKWHHLSVRMGGHRRINRVVRHH